jgi:quercetin dioxygenase-like cupin family protein
LLNIIFDFSPGAGFPKHFHGGHALVTVLNGEITLREKGTERIITTGGTWTENREKSMRPSMRAARTTRVAASVLLPKGAETTTIIKK